MSRSVAEEGWISSTVTSSSAAAAALFDESVEGELADEGGAFDPSSEQPSRDRQADQNAENAKPTRSECHRKCT